MGANQMKALRNYKGAPLELLGVAGRPGIMSFGAPIAYLGYFHEEYVVRRKWLDERSYADLLALCQMIPGPASSRLGIAIGIPIATDAATERKKNRRREFSTIGALRAFGGHPRPSWGKLSHLSGNRQ